MGHVRTYSTRMRLATPLALIGTMLCRANLASAGQATPVAGDAGLLDGLLAAVPAKAGGGESDPLIATFADLAGQLRAVGAAPPASIEDDARKPWLDAISPLALPEPFRSSMLRLEPDLVGFAFTDVDAAIEAGTPPETVVVLQGRFDPSRLQAAWAANGYQMLDVSGTRVASLAQDVDIVSESKIGQIALAYLNNAALLPDGSLAYTASLDMMTRLLSTARGESPSLAERVDIRALLDAQVDELVTGVLFPGLAVAGLNPRIPVDEPGGMPAIATQVASLGEMPPISLGLLGITGGGPLPLPIAGNATPDPSIPTARVIYSVLMLEPGTAEKAGAIARARLETMTSVVYRKPFRELFASWETTVLADGRVLRLEITLPAGTHAGVWPRHLFSGDATFLAW